MAYPRPTSLQSCPVLCNAMDCSLPGSSAPGILQARILEWVAMPSSKRSSQPRAEPLSLKSPALAGEFFTTPYPNTITLGIQGLLCEFRGWWWISSPCACVCLVSQLCLTLCNPMDSSLPGSSVCRIFQARILE